MKSSTGVALCFAAGIACGMLHALPPAGGEEYEVLRTADVWVVPDLRGDIALTIATHKLPGVPLDDIRRTGLPCNWRLSQRQEQLLEGTCRRYLASDGGAAQGTLALGPLVIALRRAGAQLVNLELNDFGRPLERGPASWTAYPSDSRTPFGTLRSTTYRFRSDTDADIPEAFVLHIGREWSRPRLAIPFLLTLFGPPLVVLLLRWRAGSFGPTEAGAVWVHWMLTGVWIYWDSSVAATDVAAFVARLQIDSMLLTLLIGAAVFTIPPLLSTASCVAALMRTPARAADHLVFRSVAREAAALVPFGILAFGLGMFEQDWKMSLTAWPIAYLTWRALYWRLTRRSLGAVQEITPGDLAENIGATARRAKVRLGAIHLASTRAAHQATAHVSGSRIFTLTRGLVEHLTRRELHAVIGHQVLYLRCGHIPTRTIVYWTYLVLVGPIAASAVARAHLPQTLLLLPVVHVAYILCCVWLSRLRESRADACAVELTGDPQGLIAALARLRKIARSPIDWGGMQGSIVSHPSVRDRVLVLAKRFGVDRRRALALLDDPDLLSADESPEALYYSLAPKETAECHAFTSVDKGESVTWARWIGYLPLVAITLATLQLAQWVAPRPSILWLAALCVGVPVTGWLYGIVQGWLDRLFLVQLRRKRKERVPAEAAAGIFAGLLPGDLVTPEAFSLWDTGFLVLAPGSLTFYGERSRFSLSTAAVSTIQMRKGPPAWRRSYAVTIGCSGGCFTVLRADRGSSRSAALRLEQELEAWRHTEPVECAGPPPELLMNQAPGVGGLAAIPAILVRAVLLCLGLAILEPFGLLMMTPAARLVPFVAAAAYLWAVCPNFLPWTPADLPVEKVCEGDAAPAPASTQALPG